MKIHPKSYSLGYVRGCSDERDQYRVAAFGALRRAAEFARAADMYADEWARHHRHDESREARQRADSIRRAIRVAIGSDRT